MKQELIDKRLRGELPVIRVGGEDYIIDWRLKELRCSNIPDKRIMLSGMEMNADGTEYVCLFDTSRGEVINPSFPVPNPDDIAVLHIPYELKLDPVGVAREYGLGDKDLLDKYPIEEELEAKIRPLNRQELNNIKKQVKQPGQRRNRGRRL